jgi:cupin fold WbuC family metalloprotein
MSAFVFGRECLDALTEAARASPRRRKNLDFHATPAHPANRLLNAVEPDSYVRPHRHREATKDETFVVLRGAFGLLLFDEHGKVTQTAVLRAGGDEIGAHVPTGTFHALVSLEPGSVFFEVKAGPYDPDTAKDWPDWAPAEGSAEAAAYLSSLRALFD